MMRKGREPNGYSIPADTGGLNPLCRTVNDLLDLAGGRNPPRAAPDAPIGHVIEELIRHPHSQRVYVVDDENRLLGTVSVRTITRHVFSHGQEPRVHPRRLLSSLTSETAEHIMQKARVVVRAGDDLSEVVKALLGHRSAEAAVVDPENRLVGDLTMIDLLKFCRPERGGHGTDQSAEGK